MTDQKQPPPPETIAGRYLRHSNTHGFLYGYTCSLCKREFVSTAPEANAPALCHGCYTGRKEP